MKVEDAIKELQELQAVVPGADIIMITVAKNDLDDAYQDSANEGSEYGGGRYVEPVSPKDWEKAVHRYEQADGGQHRAYDDVIEWFFTNPVVPDETG